ncbi:MAG: hypothetical protein RRY39_11625 [Odoribacter sp.]
MKNLIYIFLALFAFACNGPKIGYLSADNAEYIPDSLVVPSFSSLDYEDEYGADYLRVKNDAPWVTLKIEKVLGTAPLLYELMDVKASEGGDAEAFKKVLKVRGAGVMEIPLKHHLPAARYTVSIRISNEDYSAVAEDAYTFIVE